MSESEEARTRLIKNSSGGFVLYSLTLNRSNGFRSSATLALSQNATARAILPYKKRGD
jgi:hypothetical protein